MKLVIALSFFAIILTAFTESEASNSRQKRAVAIEFCPKDSSVLQCINYAESVSKTLKYCHRYTVSSNVINWASCGTVSCGGDLHLVEEDLSKPYPQCCKSCA